MMAPTKKMMTMIVITTIICMSCTMAQKMKVPGESGPQVVEAVVDQVRSSCVLAQDNLLLRRLAYVESRDGTDPQTYRDGFDGGIWQVTQAMYDVTKSANDLDEAKRAISDHLMIDWSATHWSDLRAPLFSGLAAALYIRHSLQDRPIPVGIGQQQQYWASVYHTESLSSHDTRYTDLVNLMEKGCQGQPLIDIIFVVDTSSSISDDDFEASKAFIANTTSQLNMTQERTRVAVITYSSEAQVRIQWGTHQQSHQELNSAIEALSYQRGGTETDDALDLARGIFVQQARADALKVLVLITDGESHDPIDTAHAASRLTAEVTGILVLAVGVGNQTNEDELRSIATDPPCTHVFRVNTYNQINALIEAIVRITCRAPVILHPGETVSCAENTCPPYMVEQPPGKRIMLEISTSCYNGSQFLYGSPIFPYPTQSSASISMVVAPGGFNVLHLPRNNFTTSFYNIAVAPGYRVRCRITLHSILDIIQVLCIEGGVTRNCTQTDILNYRSDTGNNLCP